MIRYKDWVFNLVKKNEIPFLAVSFFAEDPETGITALQYGRLWVLDESMPPSEVVHTALKAVLTAEEHEAREAFSYRDAAVFRPHLNVEAIADELSSEDRLKAIESLDPHRDLI